MCQEDRVKNQKCNKKCHGESSDDSLIWHLKCELIEKCQRERKQGKGSCDKKCEGEDPKHYQLGQLECQLNKTDSGDNNAPSSFSSDVVCPAPGPNVTMPAGCRQAMIILL